MINILLKPKRQLHRQQGLPGYGFILWTQTNGFCSVNLRQWFWLIIPCCWDTTAAVTALRKAGNFYPHHNKEQGRKDLSRAAWNRECNGYWSAIDWFISSIVVWKVFFTPFGETRPVGVRCDDCMAQYQYSLCPIPLGPIPLFCVCQGAGIE